MSYDLPNEILEATESLISGAQFSNLKSETAILSSNYRNKEKSDFHNEASILSYIHTRMPATYAACRRVFEILQAESDFQPQSILDVGCGPGTATIAALNTWGSITNLHLCEENKEILKLASTLTAKIKPELPLEAQSLNLNEESPIVKSDLTIVSYLLNELSPKAKEVFVKNLFAITDKALCIIEPGTPEGFKNILIARDVLLKNAANILAPCPHHLACPSQNTERWCHFRVRFSRTKTHKALKGGTLGYEEEPFSFLVVSPQQSPAKHDRIISYPKHEKGRIVFELCAKDGTIQKEQILSRNKAEYSIAKKLKFGDCYSFVKE